MEEELPNGWVRTKLGRILILKNGFAFKSKDYIDFGISVIRISNIKAGQVLTDNSAHVSKELFNENFLVEQGDILVAMSGATTGKYGIYESNEIALQNQRVGNLKPLSEEISKKFIYYLLGDLKEEIEERAYGAAQPNISAKMIQDLDIKLPPLLEQKRIISKLDALFGHLDTLKTKLDRIPELLKNFRQQVLTQAVTGKLTEEWREGKETENSILNEICDAREDHYRKLVETARKNGKSKPKKLKVVEKNVQDLPPSPESWNWDHLVNISNIQGGVTKGRNLRDHEIIDLPYLRVANVQDGYLDLNEIKTIAVKVAEKEKYLLESGDILFTEGGDRDKLGRGTVWDNEVANCIHQNHVFRARLYSSKMNPRYVSLYGKSNFAKDYFFKNASQSVNLASINVTNLGLLPVPIPSETEQKEIMRRVDSLFDVADKIESQYYILKEKIDQLPQAILNKAFQGALVPQDPNDEPASELLKRIKVEKEGDITQKRR